MKWPDEARGRIHVLRVAAVSRINKICGGKDFSFVRTAVKLTGYEPLKKDLFVRVTVLSIFNLSDMD